MATCGLTIGSLMIASSITETGPVSIGLGPFFRWGGLGLFLGGLIPLGGTYMKHGRRMSEGLKAELTTFGLLLALGLLLTMGHAAMTNWHHVGAY